MYRLFSDFESDLTSVYAPVISTGVFCFVLPCIYSVLHLRNVAFSEQERLYFDGRKSRPSGRSEHACQIRKIDIQSGPKMALFLVCLIFTKYYPIFKIFFTVRIRRKFVIILSLNIPPHLKCVATLPCEMSSVLKVTYFVRLNFITESVTLNF